MCPQGRAHWHHLANTIKLVLFSAHPSSQPKLQIDRFSRFCTVHGRKCMLILYNGDPFPKIVPSRGKIGTPSISRFLEADRAHNPNCITIGSAIFAQVTAECQYTLSWVPLSPNIDPSHVGSGPPSKTRFLGPIRAHRPNGISISSAVFAQMTTACPYTLQWDAPSPSKLSIPMGDLDPPSNTWSLGPSQVLNPNGISIGSAVLAGLTSVTARQTDHATRSVTVDHIYVRSTAMWSNNN